MSEREIIACRNCLREISYVGGCVAEGYAQFVGRAGRHGRRCWRGAFPRTEDYGRSASVLSIRNVAKLARLQETTR